MTETDHIENGCEHEQKAGRLAGVLTGWGVPGSIARILAGAIIGALAAIAAMSQSGCTATLDVYPDGGRRFDGSFVLPQPVNQQK